jgi:hypothetical protein
MKAVSFLQYLTEGSEPNDVSLCVGAHIAAFYSQPFKPELIELFEGWRDEGAGIYTLNKSYVDVCALSCTLKAKSKLPYTLIPPSTLDRFIGHCEEAGIELEWKEEVVDKYFK